jgi:hypothetical protein
MHAEPIGSRIMVCESISAVSAGWRWQGWDEERRQAAGHEEIMIVYSWVEKEAN